LFIVIALSTNNAGPPGEPGVARAGLEVAPLLPLPPRPTITPLLTMVTVSDTFQDVSTVKAYEPVDDEKTLTEGLIVNVMSVLPALYPGAFAVLST
jgi:hypothetical protein